MKPTERKKLMQSLLGQHTIHGFTWGAKKIKISHLVRIKKDTKLEIAKNFPDHVVTWEKTSLR